MPFKLIRYVHVGGIKFARYMCGVEGSSVCPLQQLHVDLIE